MQTKPYSFEEIGMDYISDIEMRSTKRNSSLGAMTCLRQFLRLVPDLRDQPMNKARYKAFVKARKVEVKASTVNSNLRFMKAALRYGLEEGLLTELPFKLDKKLWLKEPQKRHRFLTHEERKRLLDVSRCDWRLHAVIKTALYTGCRADELRYLQIRDIDFNNHSVSVCCKPEFNWEPKNWGERVLPVPEEFTKWLHDVHIPKLRWAAPEDFLLPHKVDVPGPPEVRRWTHQLFSHLRNKVFTPAGIDPTLKMTHLIRATYVTDILQVASIETARQIVGHSAAVTTIGYASALDSHKVDAVRKVFSSGDGRGLQSRREL